MYFNSYQQSSKKDRCSDWSAKDACRRSLYVFSGARGGLNAGIMGLPQIWMFPLEMHMNISHTAHGRNPVNSPVEVGSWNPIIYKVLAPSKRWLFGISSIMVY